MENTRKVLLIREFSNVPVVMLTARAEEMNKIRLLELGAVGQQTILRIARPRLLTLSN